MLVFDLGYSVWNAKGIYLQVSPLVRTHEPIFNKGGNLTGN